MEPIGNLSKVMELLRRQISARANRSDLKGLISREQVGAKPDRTSASPAQVEARVVARLAELDLNSNTFAHKACRVLLNEVLQAEFGERLWAMPEFQTMIEAIGEEWQRDGDLVAALRALASERHL